MKQVIILLSFLFTLQIYSQTNAEKIVWSKKTSDVTKPYPWWLFHSNENNFYYLSEPHKLGIQYLLMYDENSNLIKSKLTGFHQKVDQVLKFDDEHIFFIILKKEKRKYVYYASTFNSKTGEIGKLKLFSTIDEKSFSIRTPLELKTILYEDENGWALSPDKSTYIHILPIDNKKQEGQLKVRLAYYNNKLKEIDRKIIELPFLDKLNNIQKFFLLDNNELVLVVNTYKTIDGENKFKHVNFVKIDIDGNVEEEVIDDEFRNRRIFVADSNKLFYFYERFDETSQKTISHTLKIDSDLDISYDEENIASKKNNNWEVHISKTKIYNIHSYFHTYEESYTSSGNDYYRTVYVYHYFDIIILDKQTGEQISYNRFKTDGRNYSYMHNEDLYISYRIETDKKHNKDFISDVYLLKVDKYGDFSKALISDIELMKNKTKSSYIKWTYFSKLRDRFLFERTMHWDYFLGTLKIDDIKFKEFSYHEFDIEEEHEDD